MLPIISRLFGAHKMLCVRRHSSLSGNSSWKGLAAIGVHSSLLGKLQARFDITRSTPVQAAAFDVVANSVAKCPEAPSRYDIAIHSETGSGKTLAYIMPLISQVLESTTTARGLHASKTRIVVVVPTRELAHQVFSVVDELCRPGKRRGASSQAAMSAISGASNGSSGPITTAHTLGAASAASLLRVAKAVGELSQQQLQQLCGAAGANEAPHILIGTPQTLSRLIPGLMNCGQVTAIVLDEADELVRNQHAGAVKALAAWAAKAKHRPALIAVSATPAHGLSAFLHSVARTGGMKQVNLLSPPRPRQHGSDIAAEGGSTPATSAEPAAASPPPAADAASAYLSRSAMRLGLSMPATLQHLVMRLPAARDAFPAFTRFLAAAKPQAVLSFHNSAASLEAAEVYLRARNVRVAVLGAAYDSAQRNRSLQALATGQAQVLLATEMAARGLDLPRLSHVVNFDAPSGPREYVHRAGRVGRLSSQTPGRRGTVVTFAVGAAEAVSVPRMLTHELGLDTRMRPQPPPLLAEGAAPLEAETPQPRGVEQPSAAAGHGAAGAAAAASGMDAASKAPYLGLSIEGADSAAETVSPPAAASVGAAGAAELMLVACVRGELVLSQLII